MKMYFKYLYLISSLILILPGSALAQETIVQTVKGKIIDQDSNSPIIGANVVILGSDPILGSSTGVDGSFKIPNVPIGRITIAISSIGYEQRTIPDITVGAGKEVVLTIGIQESLIKLEEIVISDRANKSEVSNEMVQVSGRTFSVEETNRYAGTINDPARAVTNFAGIQGNAEGSNHIIVRGNSPNAVQWRMDGVVIPNPNHFSEEGSAGGNINILNSKMLANSDFYTGAFTSEYNNVMGGVFDMKMRTGNKEEREYSLGVGILGTDITMEGPFVKGGNSSFLANYRYSTLGILDNLGIVDFGGVPNYQDLSFKLAFPTKNAGLFTVFGLGGMSGIKDDILDEETDEVEGKDKFSSSMSTLNITNVFFLNKNSSFESFITFGQNGSGYNLNTLNQDNGQFEEEYDEKLNKYTIRTGTSFLSKINARNTIKTGITYNHFIFDFNQKFKNNEGVFENWLQDDGDTGMVTSFLSWKHRLNEKWTFTAGLNYTNFLLNQSQVIEPRGSVKYKISETQSIFAGFGIHSQAPALPMYYSKIEDDNGQITQPNLEVGLMKAAHYVIGYDRMISENLYFKSELYYQHLYDIPVEDSPGSTYSVINSDGGFTDRKLINEGTGVNYGIELTLEKYLARNFYFLITGSLFDSKYTALDGITRNARFNGNFVGNLLVGKEFFLGKTKNKILSLNSKVSLAGARRYTEIDLTASINEGRSIRDEQNAYAKKGDDVLKVDLSCTYSWNKRKTRQEIKLAVQNLTNGEALVDQYFNSISNEIENSVQLTLFPTLTYTLEF